MKTLGDAEFIDDFLRGQNDCSKGVDHKPDQSDAYTRGYNAEYAAEQILSTLSEKGVRNHV